MVRSSETSSELTDSANSGIGSGNLYSAALQMSCFVGWGLFCKGRIHCCFELKVEKLAEKEEKGEFEEQNVAEDMKFDELSNAAIDKAGSARLQAIFLGFAPYLLILLHFLWK